MGTSNTYANHPFKKIVGIAAMHPQIPLDLGPKQELTFNNFWQGNNATLLCVTKQIAHGLGNDTQIFINGSTRSGKTHLLIATCQAATESGYRIAYLSGKMIDSDHALQGYDQYDLVCIDDLHFLPQQRGSELALFGLINGLRHSGGRLLLSANGAIADLDIRLGDLLTRLNWGASYTLNPVAEEDFNEALLMRAQYLGLNIPTEVFDYLRLRCTREFATLVELLALLNNAAMQQRRKITIPFVRSVLISELQPV